VIRRTLAAVALAAVLAAACLSAATALAGHPIGNSNYIALDKRGRPYITLWMKTRKTMVFFGCYHWAKGPRQGDHLNNDKPITVRADGTFSYNGPATYSRTRTAVHVKLSGHFVSGDLAVGTLTTICATHYRFRANRDR
jgi:hypothetical protein